MRIKQNNLTFEYRGTRYNVPLDKPWEVYKGKTQEQNDYVELVNRVQQPPNYFVIHLTTNCNLSCSYCFNRKNKEHLVFDKDLVDDTVQFILSQRSPEITIRFFGGEPFLHYDMMKRFITTFETKNKIPGKKLKYNVFTNGTILRRNFLELLSQYNFVVFISIDGDKDTHDKNRKFKNGKGSYNIVIENATKLNTLFPNRVIVRTILDYNQENVNIIRIATSLASQGFNIISIEFPWFNDQNPVEINPSIGRRVKKDLFDFSSSLLTSIFNRNYHLIGIHPFSKYLKKFLYKENFLDVSPCSAGVEFLAISTNGDIYPCHSFVGTKDFKLGNVKKGITKDKVQQQFKECSTEILEVCRDCAIRYFCSNRCLADSYYYNNSLVKPNPTRCEIEREIMKNVFYIYHTLITKMPHQAKLIKRFFRRGGVAEQSA